jgi:hypothetical protein
MPPRGLLIPCALVACNTGEPAKPPPPPPPPVGGNTMPGQGSAAAVFPDAAIAAAPADAQVFALFDHIAVRQVKAGDPAKPPIGLPASPAHPKLAVKPTTLQDALCCAVSVPSWCQRTLKGQRLVQFHPRDDGGFIATTVAAAALIDADHHPELAIDFSGLTVTSEDGTATAVAITDAWAIGGIVVVSATDISDSDGRKLLVAIDVATGGVLWRRPRGIVQDTFAIANGLVLEWSGGKIRARRLRDGEEVGSVAVPGGPYDLGRTPEGTVIARSGVDRVFEVAVQ